MRYLALITALVATTANAAQGSRTIANPAGGSKPIVTSVTDPRDGGPLDFRRVTFVQTGEFFVTTTLYTWRGWSNAILPTFSSGVPSRLKGKNRLAVLYDVNGDGKTDFIGRFSYGGKSESGTPIGSIWIIDLSTLVAFDSPLSLVRPHPSSASFYSPMEVFDFLFWGRTQGTKTLHLAFTSLSGTHRDRIPNKGWISLVFRP
jgi:hypothetical protein